MTAAQRDKRVMDGRTDGHALVVVLVVFITHKKVPFFPFFPSKLRKEKRDDRRTFRPFFLSYPILLDAFYVS